MSLPTITFFRVRDPKTKIRIICQQVEEAFKQERRILIATPNEEAAKYIDRLLWRVPEESFLPHQIEKGPNQSWIAITTTDTHNWNQASILLNLCAEISPIYDQFEAIHELLDETHPEKYQQSQKKWAEYESKKLQVKERA
jgi:DNA polymerase-3 subunit chi